jgi:hypothetical protein
VKTSAAIAVVVALAAPLAGGAATPAQSASCRVPCLHDWRRESAGWNEPAVQRMAANIAAQCADSARIDFSRVDSNPGAGWDGLIAEIQRGLPAFRLDPVMARWSRAMLQMAQDEKAHLARGLADCARNGELPAKPNTAPELEGRTRVFSLDGMLVNNGIRAFSYDLDPIYRSWVPAYIKRMLDAHYASHAMYVECSGPVWIQRGNSRVPMNGKYTNLQLRPGDIIQTGKGGSVRVSSPYSSRDIKLGENSAAGLGQDVACLSTTEYPTQRVGFHLITGTLYWLATGSRLQVNCPVLTTKDFAVSVMGTQFSIRTRPGIRGDDISIDVTDGSVEIEDRQGRITTLEDGEFADLTYGLGKMMWAVDNQCKRSVDFRLFDRTNRLRWPADPSKVWIIDSGGLLAQQVSCIPGAKICYGAAAPGQKGEWGVGINGDASCADCCQTCPAADQRLNTSRVLTCQIPGAVK